MMYREGPAAGRQFRTERTACDLVVVGGGLAGTCCAITAARAGLRVTLIQDRPVLGGNASSEVRLWALGATSHMGNNNRWAREGGVIDEILLENTFRNREGNPLILDTVLLEKVACESNITLLLNTAMIDCTKADAETIASVRAFCSQNSTMYEIEAPLFCDASGDGALGFLAGAAFRMGAESCEEFGEKFAPTAEYGELLGHSLYFYTKDTGKPVRFVAPDYALKDITQIPRYRRFNTQEHGCQLWWIEYGGRLDTVHQSEAIKWELWRVIYGVWDYIKNSGEFPEAETMTLEWVGQVPGKRESRRFEGDYMLTQHDLIEQREHDDAVSYGGWAVDLHPADGVFSEKPSCNQWHSKGVYQIPYRCLYSRNIKNLFLAGRIISASHVAFGSSRVMATCAHAAQAVGVAAAICRRNGQQPAALASSQHIGELQRELMRTGQYIPGHRRDDPDDLAQAATITASSCLRLDRLPPDGLMRPLEASWAMLMPLSLGPVPQFTFQLDVAETTTLRAELRTSSRSGNFTPDVTLATREIPLPSGEKQDVTIDFHTTLERSQYAFVCLMGNRNVAVRLSQQRLTGVLAANHRFNGAVATSNVQRPPEGIGIDTFEFWLPQRRPQGQNLAVAVSPALDVFKAANVTNGIGRPTDGPNAWVATLDDPAPSLTLSWPQPQTIARIELTFDTDADHPLESVLMQHPEQVMPFCVREYRVCDGHGNTLHECRDNHQTRNVIRLPQPVVTERLVIELSHPLANVPAALFEVSCYGPDHPGAPLADDAISKNNIA